MKFKHLSWLYQHHRQTFCFLTESSDLAEEIGMIFGERFKALKEIAGFWELLQLDVRYLPRDGWVVTVNYVPCTPKQARHIEVSASKSEKLLWLFDGDIMIAWRRNIKHASVAFTLKVY